MKDLIVNKYRSENESVITQAQLMNFSIRGSYIPINMHNEFLVYFNERVPVGRFLTAVLANDLMEATGSADDQNVRCLHVYAAFLYNHAPVGSYGSKENVSAWLMGEKGD